MAKPFTYPRVFRDSTTYAPLLYLVYVLLMFFMYLICVFPLVIC